MIPQKKRRFKSRKCTSVVKELVVKICMGTKMKQQSSNNNMKIARKVYGNPKNNFCRLCLKEKLLIIKFPNQNILLNKRSEFISKCRHENKLLIVNMK